MTPNKHYTGLHRNAMTLSCWRPNCWQFKRK